MHHNFKRKKSGLSCRGDTVQERTGRDVLSGVALLEALHAIPDWDEKTTMSRDHGH